MNNTQDRKRQVSMAEKQKVAEAEGFPIENIDSFVVWMGPEPYITGAGLQYKMLQTYKAGKFAVQTVIPSAEEYSLLRRMMGMKAEEPLVVMRGEVWVDGYDRPFVDYGTTSPKNLKGFVKFSDYPLEMAARRASNRAMRLATATGMCSVDEIKEGGEIAQQSQPERQQNEPAPSEKEEAPPAMTPGQRDLIVKMAESHHISEKHKKSIKERLGIDLGFNKKTAQECIDFLKKGIEQGRAAEAAAKNEPAPSEPAPSEEADEEKIVSGISGPDLDDFRAALRENNIGPDDLAAWLQGEVPHLAQVVNPQNAFGLLAQVEKPVLVLLADSIGYNVPG